MVPWPTTRSPEYRQAIWPGAVRSAGSASSIETCACAPAAQVPRETAGERAPVRAHAHPVHAVARAMEGDLAREQPAREQL